MEPQEISERPLYLPPLSLSPYLKRKRKQEEKQKKIPAEEADQSLPTNKTAEDPESFTTAPMNELKRQRRNSICAMLMPAEYFAALPHLELLNVRYEFGLEEEPASGSGSKDEG